MGTDIHLHVEYRHEGYGERWLHYTKFRPKRNYAIFAYLADPLDQIKHYAFDSPVLPARGLPDDATPETRVDETFWKDNSFIAPSWISADEINDLATVVEVPGYTQGPSIRYLDDWVGFFFGDSFKDQATWMAKGVTDLRFVFWFDT